MVNYMKKELRNVKVTVSTKRKGERNTATANASPNYTEPRIPRMMTIRQIAATGILPEAALRRLVKDGTIPALYSGSKALINFDNLCEMLSQLGAAS